MAPQPIYVLAWFVGCEVFAAFMVSLCQLHAFVTSWQLVWIVIMLHMLTRSCPHTA